MIPLPFRDNLARVRFPALTVAIIGLNAVVWLLQLAHGVDLSVLDYGLLPAWLLHGTREGALVLPGLGRVWLYQEVPVPFTLLTSMFMHGGWLHILSNMWFLWIFGAKVEDAMGPGKFGAFYLASGLLAAAAHVGVEPASTVPMVGASGAIAGVLGAYALLYPRARVRCLWILVIFITFIEVRAWLLLGVWFASQFLLPGPGVAWVAHVGGFLAGLLLVNLFAPRWSWRRQQAAAPPEPRLVA